MNKNKFLFIHIQTCSMNQLLHQMFAKRFCLNSDTSPQCGCGKFNHVACVYKGKDRQ